MTTEINHVTPDGTPVTFMVGDIDTSKLWTGVVQIPVTYPEGYDPSVVDANAYPDAAVEEIIRKRFDRNGYFQACESLDNNGDGTVTEVWSYHVTSECL